MTKGQTSQTDSEIGLFDLGDGDSLIGRLTLAGSKTLLSLNSKSHLNLTIASESHILGSLNDLTKVSLIDCISFGTGSRGREGERNYFADVFPHFVVRGNQHLTPSEKAILEVHFVIDDATTLFYDFDAFGSVIDARPLIEQVVAANKIDRDIPIGEHPQVLYFTGKQQIFCADTSIGKVSAYHAPSWNFGGPNGVHIKNTIRVRVEFGDAVEFRSAIDRVYVLRNYLGLLVGRPQKIRDVRLLLKSDPHKPIVLDVHWSFCPTRKKDTSERRPHPGDVLIDAVREPEAFSKVLAEWLVREPTWSDARGRFEAVFEKARNYDIDRLIGSANMFDILPATAVPGDVEIGPELQEAKRIAQRDFKNLPASPERDSVLGVLGRIGKASLKRKVRFRAQSVLDALPESFPDLLWVVDQAVDCRNYFVHGGKPQFDYGQHGDAVWFFADTLEFIFGVSDLIEAGWDIKEWNGRTSVSHPFGRYVRGYSMLLHRLKLASQSPAIVSRAGRGEGPDADVSMNVKPVI